MIEVELPDGTIAEFPDGTSNDVIKGALQKRFAKQPDPRDSFMGKVDSAVRGAADTLSLGFADEIAAGLGTGFGMLGDYDAELARQRGIDKADAEDRFGYRLGGQVSGGLASGAGLVKAGLSPAAAAIQSGWRLPGVALASGAEGALLSGAYGFGSGEGLDDRLGQAGTNAAVGGVLGLLAPYAVSGVQKAFNPSTVTSERQAAADILRREGVVPTAGQVTGSSRLKYLESEMGGSKIAQMLDDQAEAFTDAAMRRAGGAGRATPENMEAMASRLSQGFDDISARNTLTADGPLLKDLVGTLQEYNSVLPSEQKQILANAAIDIGERIKAGQGTLSGTDYQTIRSRLTTRAHNARGSDNELAAAYRGLRDALDNAMERSINPGDAGAWGELRRQYGNMKVLERAATGGGENSALGLISPAQLRVASTSGNRGAYARGEGDFAELSRAGNALLTPLPNSGTASRLSARNLGASLSTLFGAGGGASVGGPMGAVAGALLGSAAPAVAGRAMLSGPVQRYLTGQMGTKMSPQTRALVNALINAQGSVATGRIAAP